MVEPYVGIPETRRKLLLTRMISFGREPACANVWLDRPTRRKAYCHCHQLLKARGDAEGAEEARREAEERVNEQIRGEREARDTRRRLVEIRASLPTDMLRPWNIAPRRPSPPTGRHASGV